MRQLLRQLYLSNGVGTNWFVFGAAGRLLFQTNANAEWLGFTYDAANNLLSLADGKRQTNR
jgi:YD repeat-containing protein